MNKIIEFKQKLAEAFAKVAGVNADNNAHAKYKATTDYQSNRSYTKTELSLRLESFAGVMLANYRNLRNYNLTQIYSVTHGSEVDKQKVKLDFLPQSPFSSSFYTITIDVTSLNIDEKVEEIANTLKEALQTQNQLQLVSAEYVKEKDRYEVFPEASNAKETTRSVAEKAFSEIKEIAGTENCELTFRGPA